MPLITTTPSHCRDCYKCLRSCPLKAIRICKGAVQIEESRCIFDGRCITFCPQGAIQAVGEVNRVKKYIRAKGRVIASLSPTTALAFGGNPEGITDAFMKLGFAGVEYMADAGAAMVREYERVLPGLARPVISSHCPAVCELMEKYFPEALNHLAPVADPAVCHARIIKSREEGPCRVIYVGPCLAQRLREGEDLDAVLTLLEVENWFVEEGIEISPLSIENRKKQRLGSAGALAVSGGLLSSLNLKESIAGGRSISLSGLEDCIKFLKNLPSEESGLEFADLMACPGGCINGPFLRTKQDTVSRRFALATGVVHAPESLVVAADLTRKPRPRPFVPPKTSQEEVNYVLRHHTSHLDCGICGYDSCLQKAKAVCEGMADVEICVPMIRTQGQETLSILEYTPNGVVLVDTGTRIRFANPSFYRMFKCEGENVLGRPVADFIHTDCFEEAIKSAKSTNFKRSIPELGVSFRACIFPITGEALFCGILNDISEEEEARQEFVKVKDETLQRAQEVIGRQMKTAQEIAGLLGETTAETKVLLVKLMNLFEEKETPGDVLL
ncbi:MAG: [Fe-Fe] hydrogenase large subunit C-terminal domain-containing protein [bacterium]